MFTLFVRVFFIDFNNRLFDFNGKSTCFGLFHAKMLENCVDCIFIFTFLCIWFSRDLFLLWLRSCRIRLLIWPIDINLKGTTTPGRSGPRSNGNEGILHTLQISRTNASPLDTGKCYIQTLDVFFLFLFCFVLFFVFVFCFVLVGGIVLFCFCFFVLFFVFLEGSYPLCKPYI